MHTIGPIQRGSFVTLDFPPIVGRVQKVSRDRTRALVNFGPYVKAFPCTRLRVTPAPTIHDPMAFNLAPLNQFEDWQD